VSEPAIHALSGSGEVTGYGHVLKQDEVDTTHGPILYLEDITVSFDGFKALNQLSLTIERANCAASSVPRRWQDDDDGRDHRQDATDTGSAFFGRLRSRTLLKRKLRGSASAASSRSRRYSRNTRCSKILNSQ